MRQSSLNCCFGEIILFLQGAILATTTEAFLTAVLAASEPHMSLWSFLRNVELRTAGTVWDNSQSGRNHNVWCY